MLTMTIRDELRTVCQTHANRRAGRDGVDFERITAGAYATQGGATVWVTIEISTASDGHTTRIAAHCEGFGCADPHSGTRTGDSELGTDIAETFAANPEKLTAPFAWAQAHATTCRALPEGQVR